MKQFSSTSKTDSPTEIRLQESSRNDLFEVVSLLNRAYRGAGEVVGWTTEIGLIDGDRDNELSLRRDLEKKPNAKLMVWKSDDEVKGCVWLEPDDNHQWYLGSFAVDPRIQNNQVGRQLLTAAEKFVRSYGGRVIKMTVIDSRDTLIAWYERRGYRRTGETVPFPYSETRFGIPNEKGIQFSMLSKELN